VLQYVVCRPLTEFVRFAGRRQLVRWRHLRQAQTCSMDIGWVSTASLGSAPTCSGLYYIAPCFISSMPTPIARFTPGVDEDSISVVSSGMA
jgi:hypothetical protein